MIYNTRNPVRVRGACVLVGVQVIYLIYSLLDAYVAHVRLVLASSYGCLVVFALLNMYSCVFYAFAYV